MSWSYSRVLVEEFSEANCLDTEQSAQLNTTPTPDQFYSHGKTTEPSRLSRFGMTCEPLTESLGEELLTWFRAGFPVRTFPLQEKAQELTESDQDCGEKWRGWLAKFDPNTCSWKTAQLSLLGDSDGSYLIFPRSGMTRGGLLWELPMLERPTSETDFGCLLPTPVASDIGHRKTRYAQGGMALSMALGGKVNPEYAEWMMGWNIGMSALKLSETAKSRNAEQQHGNILEAHE